MYSIVHYPYVPVCIISTAYRCADCKSCYSWPQLHPFHRMHAADALALLSVPPPF